MSQSFRMPTGEVTGNAKKYAAAWRAEAAAVERITGWSLYGFDPGLSFVAPTDCIGSRVVNVDLELARCITRALTPLETP